MNMPDPKGAFAGRLHELCNDKKVRAGHGRATDLARLFGLTPNATRKWLLGLGLPNLEQCITVAQWGDVNIEWLLTGRGPKRSQWAATNGVVIDEMLRSMPKEERQESVAMLRYEVSKATPFLVEEQARRYIAALDQYMSEEPS